MTEIIYNYVSIESLILFLALFSVYSSFTQRSSDSANRHQLSKLKSRMDDLLYHQEQQANEIELLNKQLNKIEEIVTPDQVKIDRLVELGFPTDVATEAVVCGEIGGIKLGE